MGEQPSKDDKDREVLERVRRDITGAHITTEDDPDASAQLDDEIDAEIDRQERLTGASRAIASAKVTSELDSDELALMKQRMDAVTKKKTRQKP